MCSPESAPHMSVPSHTQASSLSGLRGYPLASLSENSLAPEERLAEIAVLTWQIVAALFTNRCLKARATEFVSQKDVEPVHCGI